MTGFAPLSIPRPMPLETPQEPAQAAEAPEAVTHAPPAEQAPGARLTAALGTLRWTYGVLAQELKISPSTTRNWGVGRAPVPPTILRWVELLAEFHRNVPAPPVVDQRSSR